MFQGGRSSNKGVAWTNSGNSSRVGDGVERRRRRFRHRRRINGGFFTQGYSYIGSDGGAIEGTVEAKLGSLRGLPQNVVARVMRDRERRARGRGQRRSRGMVAMSVARRDTVVLSKPPFSLLSEGISARTDGRSITRRPTTSGSSSASHTLPEPRHGICRSVNRQRTGGRD